MELLLFLVPPAVTGFLFIAKWLAGLAMFNNGASQRPYLRAILVLLTLVGMVSTSVLTGNPLDADSVTAWMTLLLQTVLGAFGSHFLYRIINWIRTLPAALHGGFEE
jgi:hypothetical protein